MACIDRYEEHTARVLRTVACLCCLSLVATTSVMADDWPRWRGPEGNGRWVDGVIPGPFPGDRLEVDWRVPIGPGYSGVAVADGLVYTMERLTRRKQERVVCRSARNGQTVWQYAYDADYGELAYGSGPRATPTVWRGRVYTLGAVGHLHCFDARTGKVLWRRDLERESRARRPEWGFAASPVIYGDWVIIHAALQPGGCYAAFDGRSGREIWRAGDDPVGYSTPVVVRYRGRDGLIGWTPRHIMGLDPATGRILWRFPYRVTYGVSIATPLVADDTIVVCGYWEGSKAVRLGATFEEARLLWEENRYLRGLMSQPLHRGRVAYLLDKRHGLVGFDLASGTKRWTDGNRLTRRERNPQATMVWIGQTDHILALNAGGQLIHARLSPDGYEEFDRAALVDKTWAHPAYCDGAVFARDDHQLVKARLP